VSVYLYALARSEDGPAIADVLGSAAHSRDLAPARIVAIEPVSAVVSDLLSPQIRPNRRNLLAHMRLLEATQDIAELLPVRFGQVFETDAAITAAIRPRATAILAEIARLSGHAEVAVRVVATREKLVQALAAAHPDLKRAHAQIAAKGAAGHFELIELGRQMGELVTAWRDTAEHGMRSALEALATASHVAAAGEDVEVLRADFLIARDRLDAFEAALADALAALPLISTDDLTARLVGPSPPSSFVHLAFDTDTVAVGSAA